MAVTLQELSDFNRFGANKLSNGGVETLQQLLDEWEASREYQQCVADIRESIRQLENGESLPLKEAFAEVRRKLRERAPCRTSCRDEVNHQGDFVKME